MGCRACRSRLHHEPQTLDGVTRLQLEDHLARCARCRGDRERIVVVQRLVGELPVRPLHARDHQRAISRALLERAHPAPPPRRWVAIVIAVAVALATVLTLVIVLRSDHAPGSPLSHVPSAVPAPATRPPSRPEPPREVAVGEHLEVAGVRVTVAAPGDVWWRAAERTLRVDRGTVTVEVDPATGMALQVTTPRFVVLVTGTRFEVSPDHVAVSRGSVRIVDLSRTVLVDKLGAGQRWRPDRAGDKPPSAAVWLERARGAFAARKFGESERFADAALAASPSAQTAADAQLVRAEVAHARGRLDDAVARYRSIARQHPRLPAAELALFAAARLELARGRADAARALLRTYLDRYPGGRFAAEARRDLDPNVTP